MPRGGPIVGWSAFAIAAMCAGLLAGSVGGEEGLRRVIRATARTSAVLFTLAFVASAARRRWPGVATGWLLANRRYVGLSFAVSHLAHLLAILALVDWSAHAFFTEAGLAAGTLGALGYVILAAMAATSFDRSAAWLGRRRWQRLHTAGVYYLWFIFVATFAPRAAEAPLAYGTVTVLLVAALALRLTTARA